ncbi:hypothetical protein [Edaphobacter modestus]|uniref:hypothetical protein n=1 Tax=Edaphobacter modestus TaxID=388466 RepID=UPI0013EED86A|nr:hypothetical protein [Edaphobacter modestus]
MNDPKGEGLSLVITGLGVGIAGAIAFAHLLRSLLYVVPSGEPNVASSNPLR